MVQYRINNNKVSCVIFVDKKSGRVGYVGRAKCNPNDTFDLDFGKNLAYKRALLKLKKSETANHRKYINDNAYWLEPKMSEYLHHKNAYGHTRKQVDQLKQEIADMLGNE